jgi:WD40 repeat protein
MASQRHLVITVHGIRTFGDWQERLEGLLRAADPTVDVFNYKYGYFSVLAFMIPFLRWLVTRRFRAELLHQVLSGKWDRIDVVAHSFGTHLVVWGLYGIRPNMRPRIHTILLAGSVLKAGFPWRDLVGTSVGRVVNECGTRDLVLILNQLIVLFTGSAGREGFSGMTGAAFRNRYFAFGHSGYFLVRGSPDDAFMLKYWVPLLTSEEDTPVLPDPRPVTAWRGIMTFVFNNAEPVKLFVWVTPLVLLTLWVNEQRKEAVHQAARARVSSIITVANSEVGRQDPLMAALLLAEVPDIVARLPAAEEPLGVASAAQRLVTEGIPEAELAFSKGNQGVLAISRGGLRVLTADGDGTAWVWHLEHPQDPIRLPGRTRFIETSVFSDDGKRVITVDGSVRVWNTENIGQAVALQEATPNNLNYIGFSPDGARVVIGSRNGTVRVLQADGTGVLEVLRGHLGAVNHAGFSPDGTRIVTASADGTARVWQTDGTGVPVVLRGHQGAVNHARFSPDGTRIVTASADGTARVWQANGVGVPVVLRGHQGAVNSAEFSPDSTRIVTTSNDSTARVWRVDGRGVPVVLEGHQDEVVEAVVSPDGTRLLTVSRDGTAIIWSEARPPIRLPLPIRPRPAKYPRRLAVFTRDGRHVYTTSSAKDGVVSVWRTERTDQPVMLAGHEGEVTHAAYSPDGTRIVTTSADATARVWRADGTGVPVVLRGHQGPVNSAEFSPDGTRIVTTSNDGTARVWRADGTGVPVVLEGHEDQVKYAEFSPDGARIVTASADGTAGLWQEDGTGTAYGIRAHQGEVVHATFSPNGRLLLTCGDVTGKIWPAAGAEMPISVLYGHRMGVLHATFSLDSRNVVTTSSDGTAIVWRLNAEGQLVSKVVLEGHRDVVWDAMFSPDGTRIVTASMDGTARVWRTKATIDGDTTVVLEGHQGQVYHASFDSRGTHVVTASPDQTARVWDAAGKSQSQILVGHRDFVNSAVFSPDGKHVVTASRDGTAIVWSVDWRGLVDLLRASTTACLSVDQRIRFLGFSPLQARRALEDCERTYGPRTFSAR